MDKITGFLEVGLNDGGDIVVNHPDMKPDADGVGHIVFSPNQARNLAELLLKHAAKADDDAYRKREEGRRAAAEAIPVDRGARVLVSGAPVTDDHRELKANGQQKDYVVLSDSERAKGFVRPVRATYRHKACNTTTSMSRSIAETYARDPKFYSGTFCCNCGKHLPLDQFVWEGTNEQVGS